MSQHRSWMWSTRSASGGFSRPRGQPATGGGISALQEAVIEHILCAERHVEARAAVPPAVHPIQQLLAEELKAALTKQAIDRASAKAAIRFLGQPMGPWLHARLKALHDTWSSTRDAPALLAAVAHLADEFAKEPPPREQQSPLRRDDLRLICFEHISG